MDDQPTDQFPALQGHTKRPIDAHKVDHVRRVLWRAFKRGALSEDEFASTLDRLDFTNPAPGPTSRNEDR